MQLPRTALTALPAAVLIAFSAPGCGADRTTAELETTPADPVGVATYVHPSRDVALQFPGSWQQRTDQPPILFQTFSGRAVVTVYAYDRRAVPVTEEDLETARESLVREISERDETFEVSSSEVTEIADTPAVEVVGTGTIGEQRMRVRSAHLFEGRGEYVVDALAPPEDFDALDDSVFGPLIRSVRVGGSPPQ